MLIATMKIKPIEQTNHLTETIIIEIIKMDIIGITKMDSAEKTINRETIIVIINKDIGIIKDLTEIIIKIILIEIIKALADDLLMKKALKKI